MCLTAISHFFVRLFFFFFFGIVFTGDRKIPDSSGSICYPIVSWLSTYELKKWSHSIQRVMAYTGASKSMHKIVFFRLFCLEGLLPPGTPYHIALLFAVFNIYVYLFIWLRWVLVAACELFSCSMWDLALWPRMEPRPSAWQVQGFSHWTTRGVPFLYFLSFLKLSHVCIRI